jgi:class 3 adenylate cyclase
MSGSRTCTILFTDLVASTELRTSIGDDAFDARRRAHDRLLVDALARHDGELVKHEGDGVMAVFASAADSLSFAVAVQQGTARANGREDQPFIVRIGVSAGDVAEEEGDYHGTPVVEASRLCAAAAGGQILVAEVVRMLAGTRGGHQFTPVGSLHLKGLAEGVTAWDVGWMADDGGKVMPARLGEVAAHGACVGRDVELDAAITAWKQAASGERRLLLVAGEPGIGKTRLAAELAARVVAHGGIALHGWCDEDHGSPYQPWAQGLSAYVRVSADEDLALLIEGIADEFLRLVPQLAERMPELVPTATVDAESERARLFDAVDTFVERVTAREPMLFVLDDVHWADRPTLGLLRRLLQSDRPGSVLFVATYRDTDVDRRHPLSEVLADLRREARVSRIALVGLDEAGLGAMLADRAGHEAPADFVRVLLSETEGNPFFVEEVVAHLIETGVIYQRDGVWQSDLTADELGLPEGVRDVVGRRLSRLSERANEVLTVAAVVGRDFDLASVVVAGSFERDSALDALDAAIATGLVNEAPTTPGRFSFSHALVRQTLLEEISGARRARLHWRVGEALMASRTASLSAIAFHLCEGVLAGDVAVAGEAALAAAEFAVAAAAPDEAQSFAHRAIGVLDDAAVEEPRLRCRALLVIGNVASSKQQDIVHARECVIEAARIAERNRWADLATDAAISYSRLYTPGAFDPLVQGLARAALELGAGDLDRPILHALVSGQQIISGEWDEPLAVLDGAVAATEGRRDLGRVIALNTRMVADWGLPDRERLADWTERAVDAALTDGSAPWIITTRMSRALLQLRVGDRSSLERERDAIAALRDAPVVRTLEGILALLDGRFADAEANAAEMLAGVDPNSGVWFGASAQLAAAWYWRGRDDDLISAIQVFPTAAAPQKYLVDLVRVSTRARRGERDAQLDELAADAFAAMPWNFHRPGALCHAGSAAAWLADRRLAAQLVPLLEPYAGELLVAPPPCLVFDAADSVRGMLLGVLDQTDEAIACFEAAAAVCDQAGDVVHGVMNAHRLAAAVMRRNGPGDRERALALAGSALERATKLDLAPDVRFARAVLDGLN